MAKADWVAVAMDVGTGGAVGVVDQLLQNQDEKRRREQEAAGGKLTIMKQFGTYYNYGLPLLSVFATAFGFLPTDWATRLITAGSTVAGRKVVYQTTKATQLTPWRPAPPAPSRDRFVPQHEQKPDFQAVGIV